MAAWSAILRYACFSQTPYANGWDSYFYLVQLKSWVETGAMHSPEASLVYPFFRLIQWFTGDYVQMYQWGAALPAGAFTFGVFVVARSLCPPRSIWPLFLAAWTVCSPHLTYVAAQYPKNMLGLVLWLGFVDSLLRRGLGWSALVWGAANYFGHRLCFSLAGLFGLFWLLFRYRGHLKDWPWRNIGIAVFLLLLLYGLGARFLPGLFQWDDLARLGLHWPPQWSPWMFVQTFGADRLSVAWRLEIWTATALWLLSAGAIVGPYRARTRHFFSSTVPREDAGLWALWCLCACLLCPFLEWSYTSIAYRFLLVFVLLAPLTGCAWGHFAGARSILEDSKPAWAWPGLAALLAGSIWMAGQGYQPARHDPDYGNFARMSRQIQQYVEKHPSAKPELVIAHKALAEFFTFQTGIDAMPWLPEYSVDTMRLWRIAAGIHPPTLRYYARADEKTPLVPLGGGYLWLPESCWQRALAAAAREGDQDFLRNAHSWLNPDQQRPAWLLRRKKSINRN